MKILVATSQIPFIRGGAELLAQELLAALRGAGQEAELVAIPFKWYPPEKILDSMLACRLLDLGESCGNKVDLLIGLKFPAYLIPHPNKVLWLLHQHRTAYELWDHPSYGDLINFPNGREVRAAIVRADRSLIAEARATYTISQNVSARLKKFCALDSEVLYHPPPGAEKFYPGPAGDYVYFPSRLSTIKRQDLLIKALAHCRQPVRAVFSGGCDHPGVLAQWRAEADSLGVAGRISWLGEVSEEEKRELYSKALAVVYLPYDEDYGYVTLEAMLAAKAVLTCSDGSGPLEFVLPEQTGLVVEPRAEALAAALDRLWAERDWARRLGENGRDHYATLGIGWDRVLQGLLG